MKRDATESTRITEAEREKYEGLATGTKQGTSVYYSFSCGCMIQLLAGAKTGPRENLDHFRHIVEGNLGVTQEQ